MAPAEGDQTMLGERGVILSCGQGQRLCLARVIIKRPAMLILNEPTSAVDADSETLIWEAIDRLQKGRTRLRCGEGNCVAHVAGQHGDLAWLAFGSFCPKSRTVV